MVLNLNQQFTGYDVTNQLNDGTTIPLCNDNGTNVRIIPSDTWSCSFVKVGTGLMTDDFILYRNSTSGGAALSQSAGNLVIAAGTTANEEILLRSDRAFRGPINFRSKNILSQRIVNNNFTIELADEIGRDLPYVNTAANSVTVSFVGSPNPFIWSAANVGQSMNIGGIKANTGTAIPGRFAIVSVDTVNQTITLTVAGWAGASNTGTLTLYGWNYYRNLYTGTTATNANFDAQRFGWNSGDTVVTINTTASPGHVSQIKTDNSFVTYEDSLSASATAPQFTTRGTRIDNIPDDAVALYLWIHSTNGTTNPASNTTWTIGHVRIEMMGNTRVWNAGAIPGGAATSNPVTVTASNLSCNIAQIAGQTPLNPATNGSTNRAIVSGIAGPTTQADYSAQAWAAASGSGATIASANGMGASAGYDINATAVTLGSAVGGWVFLQESYDNGTTFRDIWQSELITTTGHTYIPALPTGGRRRMRWLNVNATGAATAMTTLTVTVTAMECSIPFVRQVQWYDRTNAVTAGTAAAGSSATYSIDGCKNFNFYVKATTATAVASYQIQFSNNGTDWFNASAVVPISATTANITLIPITAGLSARFAKFVCTAAGTAQLVTEAGIYGTN